VVGGTATITLDPRTTANARYAQLRREPKRLIGAWPARTHDVRVVLLPHRPVF